MAWAQTVKHFMEKAGASAPFDEFIAIDERLLDTNIILTHYEFRPLFSEKARLEFVQPSVPRPISTVSSQSASV